MSWDSEPPLPKSLDDDGNLSRLRDQALRSIMDEEQAVLGSSDPDEPATEGTAQSPIAATIYGGPPAYRLPAPVYGGPPIRPPAPPDPPVDPPPADDPDKATEDRDD